jgi:hypothetical protein
MDFLRSTGDYGLFRFRPEPLTDPCLTVSGHSACATGGRLAPSAKWSFTDDDWVSQVRKIMEFERTFWHDNDFPYFLVTLTPFGQDR